MEEQPLIVTEYDVKDSNLLVRYLRKVSDRLVRLGGRLARLEGAPPPPDIGKIRQALEATGSHPLFIGNLVGRAADPQAASVDAYPTAPSGLVLQSLKDSQLILTGTTSTGYTLQVVRGGNPNTLFPLISGLTTAASATPAPYSAMAYASTAQLVTSSFTGVSLGTAQYNQGAVYAAGTPTRLSAIVSGTYVFGGQLLYNCVATSTSRVRIGIRLDGGSNIQEAAFAPTTVSGGSTFCQWNLPAVTMSLASTNYIEMVVLNLGTSTTDTVGGLGQQTYMFLHKLA